MFNCCSHGTLLLIGPQGSHLSICYYHQDLHQWRLQADPRPTLQRHHCVPLTRRGLFLTRLPLRQGMGSTLQRHPFSGLVASAGELLHTPWRDSDFHGHRPAVYSNQHLSWDLMSVSIGRLNPAFGSSHSASSAYQKWPTWHSHSLSRLRSGKPDFLPI